MSEKIIRVGVVGLGRGTAIARCLKGVKNAKLIACCDHNPKILKKGYDELSEVLEDKDIIPTLEPDLREIAELRLENPESSLREIGELCSVKMSRTAVNYRLKKLVSISEELKKKENSDTTEA